MSEEESRWEATKDEAEVEETAPSWDEGREGKTCNPSPSFPSSSSSNRLRAGHDRALSLSRVAVRALETQQNDCHATVVLPVTMQPPLTVHDPGTHSIPCLSRIMYRFTNLFLVYTKDILGCKIHCVILGSVSNTLHNLVFSWMFS